MKEIMQFSSTKERLKYLSGKFEEIEPKIAVPKPVEVIEEVKEEVIEEVKVEEKKTEEKPKKKKSPAKKKKGEKDGEVQAK